MPAFGRNPSTGAFLMGANGGVCEGCCDSYPVIEYEPNIACGNCGSGETPSFITIGNLAGMNYCSCVDNGSQSKGITTPTGILENGEPAFDDGYWVVPWVSDDPLFCRWHKQFTLSTGKPIVTTYSTAADCTGSSSTYATLDKVFAAIRWDKFSGVVTVTLQVYNLSNTAQHTFVGTYTVPSGCIVGNEGIANNQSCSFPNVNFGYSGTLDVIIGRMR